ncbi:MAG TPA: TlyA family RNA methyltransferase [Candidatus Paceibacterota bacterium]|nr:TlyA family RNA methyltransferase [Candidatus Paceibacterota bacterium]
MKNRLDTELPRRGLARSRNDAQEKIHAGLVSVNKKVITKMSTLIQDTDIINIRETGNDFVGRGGKKLEGAIKEWNIDFKNKIIVDVGSSTGGFTEVALLNGAKKVYAVDVGSDQLDKKIQDDARVIVMEKIDIRKVQLKEKMDVAVIDVSFISLEKILTHVKGLLVPRGIIIALIKPQFEVGKTIATKYKGIITSEIERQRSLKKVSEYAQSIGLSILGTMESPITGTDGNVEYFAYMKNG